MVRHIVGQDGDKSTDGNTVKKEGNKSQNGKTHSGTGWRQVNRW